ncbi:hypothetical protein PAP_08125 [Palaeococcus pacificus DY20341]|uniref:Cyclase n=1 Tax=Palaeococcus pacificus DY20341 TaxID=1343739 RepID=A0A075LZJ5_9EURY|nr:cyclase family protein [Palaeococcus pacificus]AIF70013.1 hypothetical protein PAP_08125 [Palaeococcus pacificus DY20341]
MKLVDLSMSLSKETPTYPGDPKVEIKPWASIGKDGYYMNALSFGEHSGTHVDAPAHFIKSGATIEEVPLERFMGNALVIDVSNLPPKAEITRGVLLDKLGGREVKDKIVLIYTGYSKKAKSEEWRGLSRDGAELLVELSIKAVGIDAPSIDHDFEAHKALLANKVLIFENLINLEKLIGKEFTFIAFPLKIKNGSGSPVRAVAILED